MSVVLAKNRQALAPQAGGRHDSNPLHPNVSTPRSAPKGLAPCSVLTGVAVSAPKQPLEQSPQEVAPRSQDAR